MIGVTTESTIGISIPQLLVLPTLEYSVKSGDTENSEKKNEKKQSWPVT